MGAASSYIFLFDMDLDARTKGWFNLSMIRCDLTWTPALLPVLNYKAKGVFGRASHNFKF